ncbi:hypothetical protein ABPG77_002306 [Micractinium sp. CCAP 211/92]
MQWHPTMGPLPPEHATPAWVHRAAQQPAAPLAPVPTTTVVPPPQPAAAPARVPGNDGSPGSPLSPEGPAPGSSLGSVSMLTYMLKGPSAASSAAASRESSVRSGIKRQPGGLTLALSRENSTRGGAARDASVRSNRERSVREGSHRSTSAHDCSTRSLSRRSAGGRQEGSVLAQWGAGAFGGGGRGQQQQQAQSQQPLGLALEQAPQRVPATGCGSGDWMGLAPVSEALALPPPHAGVDPFAAVAAVEFCEEEDELELLPPVCQPLQPEVGSWAKRMTTFPHKADATENAVHQPPKHAGGPDPLVLTAALQALAASPSLGSQGSAAASAPGPGSGPGFNVLVGDSELATTGSSDLPSRARPVPRGGSPPRPAAGAAERRAAAAAEALAHSWDGAREAAPLQLYTVLGGSAPALGCSAQPGLAPSPTDLLHRHGGSQVPGPQASAASQEWNRSFMRRWREVKKRAYLQALGLRALWRVHSPSDRHEPLELLTNDLPQHDNGMRRAWSRTRLAALPDGAHRHSATAAQAAPLRRAGPAGLPKDPSLSMLLLGEVAEVC